MARFSVPDYSDSEDEQVSQSQPNQGQFDTANGPTSRAQVPPPGVSGPSILARRNPIQPGPPLISATALFGPRPRGQQQALQPAPSTAAENHSVMHPETLNVEDRRESSQSLKEESTQTDGTHQEADDFNYKKENPNETNGNDPTEARNPWACYPPSPPSNQNDSDGELEIPPRWQAAWRERNLGVPNPFRDAKGYERCRRNVLRRQAEAVEHRWRRQLDRDMDADSRGLKRLRIYQEAEEEEEEELNEDEMMDQNTHRVKKLKISRGKKSPWMTDEEE